MGIKATARIENAISGSARFMVGSSSGQMQTKSVSYDPTDEDIRAEVKPDDGFDGLRKVDVTVTAIPADYVGSEIPRRDESDLITTGATVNVPSGYYAENAGKTIPDGAFHSGSQLTRNPVITVGNDGAITASVSGDSNILPIKTNGYFTTDKAYKVTVTGSSSEQLPTQGGSTITPSSSIITAVPAGTFVTGDVKVAAVSAFNWIGSGITKLADCYNETTTAKAVGFESWTASTTATTLRVGQNGTVISADMAHYDYVIKWRCYWSASYNAGATLVAMPVSGITEIYQMICRRPQTLANVQAELYNQNTYAAMYTQSYQEYYNTSGIHVANWANAYGITFSANPPSYSSGDTISITPVCPSVGARCNNSYFNAARKTEIDAEHSQIRIVGEVYRVSKSALRQTYEGIVDIANHGL